MKITKERLKQIIKEEIMSEMYGDDPRMDDVYYDDPRMDDAYPEVGEAQKIVDMIMDMSRGDKAAAMQMLMNAMSMLQGEMDVAAEPMMEGVENITPENVQLMMSALQKFFTSPYTAPLVALVLGAVGAEGIRDILSKQKQGGDNDG